jgi:hypothetical protein
VLAGTLLTLTVSTTANAQEEPAVTTTATPTSEAPPVTTTSLPTSTEQQPTQTGTPTNTGTPTKTGTSTSLPTPTDTSELAVEPTELPHGDGYKDDVAYGWEFVDGSGLLAIACAVGEPENVFSNDFSVVDGPYQDGADGRYWGYDIQFHEGKHLGHDTRVSWTCEGKPVTKPVDHGGGSATVGGQVKVTPKAGGVETGGGATARS